MWGVLPDGSRYFSRTLGEAGPLGEAPRSSASDLRAAVLPDAGSPPPVRLEVNVVLPGAGHVTLRGLRVGSGAEAMGTPGAWWSDQTAGRIGGAVGGAVGPLGALIGTLCSSRPRPRFVARPDRDGVAGSGRWWPAAWRSRSGQPYAVWYPLVLLGVLAAALGFSLIPTAQRRFQALELRRMQALDARG